MVYAKDNKGKDKFGERGRPSIFVGYPSGQKGYRVFDLENRVISTSHDVKFFENIFPYKGDVDLKNLTAKRTQEWELDPTTFEIPPLNGPSMQEDDDSIGNNNEIVTWSHDNPHQSENQVQRQSEHARSQPKHLKEYEVDLPRSVDHSRPMPDSESSTVHPLSHFVSYKRFSHHHKCYLAAITSSDEPKNFWQAIKDPRWREAMKNEINALEENKTWTLEYLPPGKKAIDSKWVYKIKYKLNGEIERYKARLVAKGFTQIEGIDFHETFVPVAKLVTVQSVIAVAAKKNWTLQQLDVNNAFLHGDLDENVFMKIPQGFAKKGETIVYKLKKSLYGLRQASRNWYYKFTRALLDIGFQQSKADHSLFTYKMESSYVCALIYVDDVVLDGNDTKFIQFVKRYLNNKFSIKDLGPLKYFLGIEVARSIDGIVLRQRKYTLDITRGQWDARSMPEHISNGTKCTIQL